MSFFFGMKNSFDLGMLRFSTKCGFHLQKVTKGGPPTYSSNMKFILGHFPIGFSLN